MRTISAISIALHQMNTSIKTALETMFSNPNLRAVFLASSLCAQPVFATQATETTTDKQQKHADHNHIDIETITHEYMLPNGLKLIVRENHRAPVAIFQIWYRVGSSYEPPGITGVAHVLEHMMFKGTNLLKPGEFSELVSKYGGSDNAFTNKDYTGYYQVWEKSRMPLSFELEANRMTQLQMNEEEFQKELDVVKEERRMRVEDRPNAILFERFREAAYVSSPYQQPVIGWMHDLNELTLADTQAWYDTWYAPNNAIIVIVGDVDPTAMYELAEEYFGHIEPKDLPRAPALTEVPPLGERRIKVHNDKATIPTLALGFNVPSISTAEDKTKAYALRMLAGVLDGGYSARIEKELIRGNKKAASASAYYQLYSRGDSLFSISATPNKNTTTEELESEIFKLIDDLKSTPPTEEELQRIRAQILSSIVYQQDSISAQANQIGRLESMNLSWRLVSETRDALKKITPEQVQTAAIKYLTRNRLTVGTLIPTSLEPANTQAQPSTSPKTSTENAKS